MRKDGTFIKKLKADIALVVAALARFRVRGMAFTGGAKNRHDEQVAQLEFKIDQINSDLRYRNKVGEHLWKDLEGGLQNSWRELQSELRNGIESFHTEPGLADPHGGDDGPYPYGDLSGRSIQKNKTARSKIMGDKGGKKNKSKNQRQSKEKQKQKKKERIEKQPNVSPIPDVNRQLN